MYRKYVILTLAFVFALGATGCTSKRMEGDEADVEASTDDGLETADATENNSDLDVASTDGGVGTEDAPPSDDLATGEALPPDPTASLDAGGSEVAPGDITEAPPADAPADLTADAATPTEDVPPADVASMPEPAPDAASPTPEPTFNEAPAPVSLSLKKIASQPYREGKILINAAYVARKGDSPEAISQKVFGSAGRVKELCKINHYNCSRPLKVGDKFYYNSPQRPTDDTALKMFYEDAGVQPETYVAKSGDNIRKVGKQLLGDSRSWMELWATNSVESKGDLDEGARLRYWPTSDVAAPAQAAAVPEGAPPEMAANEPPPPEAPPGMDMAANQPPPSDPGLPPDVGQPPPPPSDLPPAPEAGMNGAAAATGMVEAPPPPPPPPPPTDTASHGAGGEMALDGSDPNQTMALGVGAVLLLAAVALFISIRKKRQRRQIDYTATQTQIDS